MVEEVGSHKKHDTLQDELEGQSGEKLLKAGAIHCNVCIVYFFLLFSLLILLVLFKNKHFRFLSKISAPTSVAFAIRPCNIAPEFYFFVNKTKKNKGIVLPQLRLHHG